MTAARSDLMALDREAFIAAHKHLDLTEDKDGWGRPKFAHDMVQALWDGWHKDRSALRLAASQPDREAVKEFIASASFASRSSLDSDTIFCEIYTPGYQPAKKGSFGFFVKELRAILSLLSGAGTKSDGGEERPASNPSSRVTPGPSDPSPGPDVRRRVLDILNVVAPAVENLARHQGQCDMDGVMVKVSRQALDEVLNAVNEVALVSALTRPRVAAKQESCPESAPRTETAFHFHRFVKGQERAEGVMICKALSLQDAFYAARKLYNYPNNMDLVLAISDSEVAILRDIARTSVALSECHKEIAKLREQLLSHSTGEH